MAIGERIRQARRISGLTLAQVAERVGVTAQAISKYEHGQDIPSSGVLIGSARHAQITQVVSDSGVRIWASCHSPPSTRTSILEMPRLPA